MHVYDGSMDGTAPCRRCGHRAKTPAEHIMNGGEPCDVKIGPCACGAWHHDGELVETDSIDELVRDMRNFLARRHPGVGGYRVHAFLAPNERGVWEFSVGVAGGTLEDFVARLFNLADPARSDDASALATIERLALERGDHDAIRRIAAQARTRS